MANSEDRHVQSKPKLLTSWSYKTKKKKRKSLKKKWKEKGKTLKTHKLSQHDNLVFKRNIHI